MNEITKKAKELDREYTRKRNAFEKKLDREYLRGLKAIKKKHRRCSVERNEYSKKFNPKTGKITEVPSGRKSGCGEYTPKKDWITVSIEDIEVETVKYDCGYGDDDQLAYVRRKDYYKVCPNCHKMQWDRFEEIGRSETFSRRGDEEGIERAKRFIPDGWTRIVKIEKK